jgi:putative acetyltransferase
MPQIRSEQSGDFESVRALLLASFGREAEARLVDRLRASGKITSALVAVDNARILGYIVFSRVVADAEQTALAALALAPLAVEPAFQRLGIGSALVSAGLERCRLERHSRVMVLGDPVYFARFGFVPAARFGLKCSSPGRDAAFMAIELEPGAFAEASGMVHYGHEFDDLD